MTVSIGTMVSLTVFLSAIGGAATLWLVQITFKENVPAIILAVFLWLPVGMLIGSMWGVLP
jgi:hypothetical protein